jgi:hypothetical protein
VRSTASLVLLVLIVVPQTLLPRSASAASPTPNTHDTAAFLAEVRKAGESLYNLGRFSTPDPATLLRAGMAACTALRQRRLGAYLDTAPKGGPELTDYHELLYMALVAGRTLCPHFAPRSVLTRALPGVEKHQNAQGRVACVTTFNFLAAASPNNQNPLSAQDAANGFHGSSVVATMAAATYARWAPLGGILSDMANEWRAGTSASTTVSADILAAAELCRPFITRHRGTSG